MLLKWLVIGGIIYVLYRSFFGANTLREGQRPTTRDDEEGYTEYEEVE